jgi:hypothetical protein
LSFGGKNPAFLYEVLGIYTTISKRVVMAKGHRYLVIPRPIYIIGITCTQVVVVLNK